MVKLRVRGRNGVSVVDADGGWGRNDLLSAVGNASGVEPERIKLLSGFPPKEVSLAADMTVSGVFSAGDMLVVEEMPAPKVAVAKEVPPPAEASDRVAVVEGTRSQEAASATNGPAEVRTPIPIAGDSIASEADFVRREVPDDNSCMFRSVSYVLGAGHVPEFLRQIVAEQIGKEPDFYTIDALGRPNDEYQAWIQADTSWGGAIELSILAKHFKTELAAFDVKTGRMDCYGEGEGYELRGYLLYDGIHYDALALALGGEAVQQMDVTMFAADDMIAQAKAKSIADREKSRNAYTDTQNFQLKCQDCGSTVRGENGALEHSKTTGHANYAEA